MKTLKIYFDTEFTDLKKDADLISVGLIAAVDKRMPIGFYCEITDFDSGKCSKFVKDNVLPTTILPTISTEDLNVISEFKRYFNYKFNYHMLSFSKAGSEVLSWINSMVTYYGFDNVEFVAACCSYDWVLLVDLLTNGGSSIDLPKYISPACIDYNQVIANAYTGGNNYDAFNLTYSDLVKDMIDKGFINITDKLTHNSMYDAIVLYMIASKLDNI